MPGQKLLDIKSEQNNPNRFIIQDHPNNVVMEILKISDNNAGKSKLSLAGKLFIARVQNF